MGGADPSSDNDDPEHEVVLYPYFIDRFEVTNERYRECVAAGACTDPDPWSIDDFYDGDAGRRYPVAFLTWQQAVDYCTWVDRRLPTEAEWEKAARGPSPDRRIYPWGDDPPTCEQAVFNDCPGVGAHDEVDAHPAGASPFGVERMVDAVIEPVSDWYAADYYDQSALVDPRGPEAGEFHADRSHSDSYPADWYPPLTVRLDGDGDGIRCARSAEER
jgi:formylglycine-generating enzyme required for sulfatase activity